MSEIDDILENAVDRDELIKAAQGCTGAILLFVNEEEGNIARVRRYNMTWGTESYLLMAAMGSHLRGLMPAEEED